MIRIQTLKQELAKHVKPLPQRNWKVGIFNPLSVGGGAVGGWRSCGWALCSWAHLKTAALWTIALWDLACKPHGCQSQAVQVPSPRPAVTTAQMLKVYKRSFQGDAGDLHLSLESQRRKQGGNALGFSTPYFSREVHNHPLEVW